MLTNKYIINIAVIIKVLLIAYPSIAAEGSGMPQMVIPDFMPQLVWLIVVFSLLYFSMKYVALPRITEIISNRDLKIVNDLEKAEEIKKQIEQTNKEHQDAVDDTNNKINFVADDQSYTLPTASSSTLGGVKVGSNLTIDGNGVLNVGAIALTTVQTAANQTAHLNLTAQEGDIVVRSDENKSYVHSGGTAGTMADYTLLLTPTDAVLSVTTTDGTYIDLTPNSAATGAINVTADLSAVDGTSDTTTRFLSKDNTWDVPSYTTETYTQHENISAASSSDNSGRTYIQDITLDSNGHVTGIATATETVVNTDTNTFRTVKVDTDGDGFADSEDDCPNFAGNSTWILVGCLDADGDGRTVDKSQ